MGNLLLGLVYSKDDTFLVGRDDHVTCMDTYVWDPYPNDISRVSAHEDTAVHTRYSVIHMEVAAGEIGDGL